MIHQSPFTQFRALGSQDLISWREANETVARIGGWRVYLRQAQQPAPAEQPITSKPTHTETQAQPQPKAGHGNHGNHGGHSGHTKP